MNNQRRLFRGRGGPNDRRLPQQNNARRRRPHPHSTEAAVPKKYDTPPPNQQQNQKEKVKIVSDEEEANCSENDGTGESQNFQNQQQTAVFDPPTEEPWRAEIRHLQQRIQRVQESIQLGTAGIATPSTYETNVLHAVGNCLNEWRAILKYYQGIDNCDDEAVNDENDHADIVNDDKSFTNENENSDDHTKSEPGNSLDVDNISAIDPKTMKETSLKVFMLLQLALQCGPLAGGKPGYFKRCGGEVSKLVSDWLETVVPTNENKNEETEGNTDKDDKDDNTPPHQQWQQQLGFSTKQMEAIATWKSNAQKAVMADKPPSKSALKKQQGISKKQQLKQKKKERRR